MTTDAVGLQLLQVLAPFGEKGQPGAALSVRLGMPLEHMSAIAVYLKNLGYVRIRTTGALVEHAAITVEGVQALHVANPVAGIHIHGGNVQIGSSNQQVSQRTREDDEDADEDDDGDVEELIIDQRPVIPARGNWRSEVLVLQEDDAIRVVAESSGSVDVMLLTRSQLTKFDDEDGHGCLANHERVSRTNMLWVASKRSRVYVVVENNEKRPIEVDLEVVRILNVDE